MKKYYPTQKLIINADDYGLSKSFNKGILELISNGIVTSVSVMILRPFVFLDDFSNKSNISIGLHLELEGKDVEEEIEKQFDLFKKVFKKYPSHLDGHQHCHIFPENIQIVADFAKKHNIPVRSRFNEDRIFFRKKGLKSPDDFISWHPIGTKKLLDKIRMLKDGTFELVCHPGYYDEKSKEVYNSRRYEELEFLKSDIFKKSIKKFKLINYYEL